MKTKTLLIVTLFLCVQITKSQTFENTTPTSFKGDVDFPSSAIGDLNGDGRVDIIVSGANTITSATETYIYINSVVDTFSIVSNSGIDRGVKWSWIDLGDYDKDGDLDVVMQGWDNVNGTDTQKTYVYKNNGNATFTKAVDLQGRSNGTIFFGDYDNDGDLDLLQTGWYAAVTNGRTTIYRNDGSSTFTEISHPVEGVADGQARWGDYDKDGKLDILLAGWNKTQIYKGNGAGGFTKTSFSMSQNHDFVWANWIDYNKDGNLDILVSGLIPGSNPAAWETKVYKGLVNGLYEDSYIDLLGVQRGPVLIGDCNNDTKLDFFISGWNNEGKFSIYKNDGSNESYSEVQGISSVITGWADGTMQVFDFNKDGYDEIFKCGWNLTKLYSNTERPTTGILDINQELAKVEQIGRKIQINLVESDKNTTVKVFHLSGQCVYSGNMSGKENIFELSNIASGSYLLTISGQNQKQSQLIIIK